MSNRLSWREKTIQNPYFPRVASLQSLTNDQLLGFLLQTHDGLNHAKRRAKEEVDPISRDAMQVRYRVLRSDKRLIWDEIRRRMEIGA